MKLTNMYMQSVCHFLLLHVIEKFRFSYQYKRCKRVGLWGKNRSYKYIGNYYIVSSFRYDLIWIVWVIWKRFIKILKFLNSKASDLESDVRLDKEGERVHLALSSSDLSVSDHGEVVVMII